MKTVALGPLPTELQTLIERRKRLGIDLFDEVWEGSYHVAPAAHPSHGFVEDQLARVLGRYAAETGLVGTGPFNLGDANDYRVPDRGYHRTLLDTTWVPTAAVVVEVVSPHDETFEKFDFTLGAAWTNSLSLSPQNAGSVAGAWRTPATSKQTAPNCSVSPPAR